MLRRGVLFPQLNEYNRSTIQFVTKLFIVAFHSSCFCAIRYAIGDSRSAIMKCIWRTLI